MTLGGSQSVLDVIRQAISQETQNGAQNHYMYGVAFNSSAYLVSAYLNASEYISDYIDVPAGWYVSAGDYIKVVEDTGGRRSVDTILPYTLYSRLAFDFTNRRVLLGDGMSEPNAGSYGYILNSGGPTGSAYWAPAPISGGITDPELLALAGLTSAADSLPYFTGSGTASLATFTSFARTLVDDVDASTARSTLGLSIGTSVQAWDADLDALAALSSTAGMVSRTGAGAFAVRTITAPAAGITVANGTGAAGDPTLALANDLSALEGLASTGIAARTATDTWAQRTITAGASIGVTNGDGVAGNPTIAVNDAELAAIAGLTSATDTLPYFTGSGTASLASFTSTGRSLVDDTSTTAMRSTLGLVIGTDVQAYDAELAAIAGLTSAADTLPYFTGSGTAATTSLTSTGRSLIDDTSTTAMRATLGLGSGALLVADTDGTLAANSDSNVATQKAVKTYVDTSVVGLLDFKGSTNCSANPNYPSALKGDAYVVSTAGKIGGASGKSVDVGDFYIATTDNAGGTEASVGTSWTVLEHNLVGALLSANNLSDVASASTARTNLGVTATGSDTTYAYRANNLSDLANAGTARTNLGVTATGSDTTYAYRANNLSDLANAGTARTNLGLAIGTNVQAWDADLDALAALASTAGMVARTGAGAFAVRTITAGSSKISVSNGTGASANPTIDVGTLAESDITNLVSDLAGKLSAGAIITSGLTMSSPRMLGRATVGSGAVEEISVTGSGNAVLATSPALTTPNLGTPSAGTMTNVTGLPAGGTSFANGDRILGRLTSPGAGQELTASQVKTLLAIASGDVSGLAAIATSGSANDLSAGTIPTARLPVFTGDVTNSGTGALTIFNVLSANTTFAFPGIISPSQLVANTDNWAPSSLSASTVIRLSTDASRNLTGITGGATGRYLMLLNIGSNPLVLKHDVTSTAANRFYCPNNVDYTLVAGGSAILLYDSTSSRWRVIENFAVGTGIEVSSTGTIQRSALTGDVTASAGSNATTLASGNAGNLNSGTLLAARMPALTGDVTTSAGGVATTLAAGNAGNLNSGTLLAARMPAHTGDVTSSVGTIGLTLAAGNAGNLNSGTLLAARMPALTGDVTTSSGAVATTIGSNTVSYAKMQDVSAGSQFLGRKSGAGSGDPQEMSASDAKTILAIASTDVSGLAAVATSGSATDLTTGTLPAGRLPALSGDVSSSAGSATVTVNQASSAFALTGDISPTQLAANTDNWAPTGLSTAAVIRLSTDASRNLTGITGGADGRILCLINIGTQPLVLKHDVTSTAANRFYCPNNVDYILVADGSINLIYDATSSRWRVVDNFAVGTSIEVSATGTIQRSALTGDVTASAGSNSTTLAAGNAGNLNSGTLLAARMPAHTGDVTSSVGTVGLTLAAGNAGNLNSGTLLAARMPALTGDVTTSSGAVATTIANNTVTYAKMQDVSTTSRLLGRVTAGSGDPEEVVLDIDGSLTANSDLNVPTQKAVKTYVTAAVATGVADGNKGDITVSGSGTVWTATGSAALVFTAAGSVSVSATLTAGGKVAYSGSVQNISSTGNLTDVAITNVMAEVTGTGVAICGIGSPSSGRVVVITNTSAVATILNHEDTTHESTAANRLYLPFGTSVNINPKCSATFTYDSTLSRWVLTSMTSVLGAADVASVPALTMSGAISMGGSNLQMQGGNVVMAAGNIVIDTTTGTQIGTGSSQKLAFWAATPVARSALAATGNVTITTAGATNTVFRNTTFTGGTGSSSYTIGDIVFALKTVGLIPS